MKELFPKEYDYYNLVISYRLPKNIQNNYQSSSVSSITKDDSFENSSS
jgi:hypothetical protein